MKYLTIRALLCLKLSLFVMVTLAIGTNSEQVGLNITPQSRQIAVVQTSHSAIDPPIQATLPGLIKEDAAHLQEKSLDPLPKQIFNLREITQDQFICHQLKKLKANKEILNNPRISKLFKSWWHLYQDSLTMSDPEEFGQKSDEVEKQIKTIIKAGIITAWQNNL